MGSGGPQLSRNGNTPLVSMHQRIDDSKAPAGAVQAMQQLQAYVQKSGLEPPLIELAKIRASHW